MNGSWRAEPSRGAPFGTPGLATEAGGRTLLDGLACSFRDGLAGPPLPDAVTLAERAGLTLDPWQRDEVDAPAPQTALLVHRQGGKSSVAALAALDEALHRPPALVLVLAVALRQAQELFRTVKWLLGVLGPAAPVVRRETALGIEFLTGSRILCVPAVEATVRSFSKVALLILDEASRIEDAVYYSVRPMVSLSRGRILLLSTPAGPRGFFHQAVTEHAAEWRVVQVPATACPRFSPAWLAAERERIGAFWFRQEFLVEFVDSADQVFATDDIDATTRFPLQPFRIFSAA